MNLTTVIDCTGVNLPHIDPPPGAQLAGYITGADGIAWTPAQLTQHPSAIRIDQTPANTPANELADILDVENGAATLNDIAAWAQAAYAAYQAGTRPGQRRPTIYTSRANATAVTNTLTTAGVTHGVPLWIAEQMTEQQATSQLNADNGLFPIIAIQYQFQTLFDVSLFSTTWLNTVSKAPAPRTKGPGTQTGWNFCSKCQGLFWGPGQSASACPRGGQHDGSHSHEYTLGFTW